MKDSEGHNYTFGAPKGGWPEFSKVTEPWEPCRAPNTSRGCVLFFGCGAKCEYKS